MKFLAKRKLRWANAAPGSLRREAAEGGQLPQQTSIVAKNRKSFHNFNVLRKTARVGVTTRFSAEGLAATRSCRFYIAQGRTLILAFLHEHSSSWIGIKPYGNSVQCKVGGRICWMAASFTEGEKGESKSWQCESSPNNGLGQCRDVTEEGRQVTGTNRRLLEVNIAD